jgi:hypothetical protein
MKKSLRKLPLSRETLHNLELRTAQGALNTQTCPPTWLHSCGGSCQANCTAYCPQ